MLLNPTAPTDQLLPGNQPQHVQTPQGKGATMINPHNDPFEKIPNGIRSMVKKPRSKSDQTGVQWAIYMSTIIAVRRAHVVGADTSHYRYFANRREYDRWLEIYDHQFGKLGEFVKGQEMGEEMAALAHALLTMTFLSFTVMLLRFVMF